MIEPVPLPLSQEKPDPQPETRPEPVVIEDLAALLRLPRLLGKVDRILAEVRTAGVFPEDFPMALATAEPGDGRVEYGLRWRDTGGALELFAGLVWGDAGQDPAWEVRVGLPASADAGAFRARGLHRLAAKQAESRFSEWDYFWHEDRGQPSHLVGVTAACTRFLEEEDPDRTARDYLAGALHALQASGALHILLQAAREA